jgi:hypothetical protein
MVAWFSSVVDVVVDLSPRELIGLIGVATILALATAGVCQWARRSKADATAVLAASILVANLIAMTMAGLAVRQGFTARGYPTESRPAERPWGPPPDEAGPGVRLAARILAEADRDGDGRLSPEEAATAADRFIRQSSDEAGPDAEALGRALNRRLRPRGPGPGGTPPPPGRSASHGNDPPRVWVR